jgi:hypothetical protein
MRVVGRSVAVLVVSVYSLAVPHGQTGDPSKILAAAREALGGDKRLSAVKTFVATGRTRKVQGDNLVPIEFEILCELPDKYLRKDEIPAQESAPTTSGFNGETLIQIPPFTAPARAGAPAPTAAQLEAASKARVTPLKQDFVRLTLGMFATSFSSAPLTFTLAGQAEAPQGKADVLDVKGPGNLAMRFFINSETHLPIMVSWQPPAPPSRPPTMPGAPGNAGAAAGPGGAGAPARPGASGPPPAAAPAPQGAPARGAAPPPSATPPAAAPSAAAPSAATPPAGRGAPAASSTPPKPPLENRIYFADYRDVDGMQFPFRIRRAVGTETVEETIFDRFRINAKIDPRRFEPPK